MARPLPALRRLLRGGKPEDDSSSQELDSLEPGDRSIVEQALPYTMTSVARLQSTIDAVRHCVARGLPGAFAECGVWRGGSVLAMILALQEGGVRDRNIHLFDTFAGMTEPTEVDVSHSEGSALETWREAEGTGIRPWPEFFESDLYGEEMVREVLTNTGYPSDLLHLVAGDVAETIPREAPPELALLRLDTDWYESTRHELEHLYPRLVTGGILIIDDYGHWQGARRAVDEYFAHHGPAPFLNRIDYTGRLVVKP